LILTLDRKVRVSRSRSHGLRGYGGTGRGRRMSRARGTGDNRLVGSRLMNSRSGGASSSGVGARRSTSSIYMQPQSVVFSHTCID
jgi:hypothetical protein